MYEKYVHNTNLIIVECRAHWQLVVLCPMNVIVIWFYSLRKKPDIHIKAAINKFYIITHLMYCKVGVLNSWCFLLTSAMKTLKTTVDGKTNQSAPQWIEVKVSHLMHPYFRLVTFSKFIIFTSYYFSKWRLWVWLLCHVLDMEHSKWGFEEWLGHGIFIFTSWTYYLTITFYSFYMWLICVFHIL